ncbi:TIGR02391 family protein [candidate division KSB1 bacterium]|nr:TIGR02391 family protein [candidate division KSB1 bacterium]
MNIETLIDKRLWLAIKNNYDLNQYTNAILNSIYFISDFIRERTGFESDGVALVGQALGGKTPKLRTSNLESESDWNIQKGIEQILRGVYQGIRNPRSHEKYSDSKEEADAIIYFINYLLSILDKSKTPFTKSTFLKRVFDENYVENERYSDLLVEEIPVKLRLEISLDVFKNKQETDGKKISYFYKSLIDKMTNKEVDQFCDVVSEELKNTNENDIIRIIIQLFPKDKWEKLDEMARLRMENILIKSVKKGEYKISLKKLVEGGLGTWAKVIFDKMILKHDLNKVLVDKFITGTPLEENYVMQMFFTEFIEFTDYKFNKIEELIKRELDKGDSRFYDFLTKAMKEGPPIWKKTFSEDHKNFVEKIQPADIEQEDDLPF